ncbi:MAG TPA: Hpt domain-containing protein [Candidatus Dormibacteraeota bacterium]|nr:Hpt domain-containing protein [Candidatus Dormibacteraeota bacterium]
MDDAGRRRPVVDLEHLTAICGGDTREILGLVRLTVTIAGQRVNGARAAAARGDVGRVAEELHDVKGMAANAGAAELHGVAVEIEARLEGASMEAVAAALAEIEAAVERLRAEADALHLRLRDREA